MDLDEALEMACWAVHEGRGVEKWRAAVGAALEEQRGGALEDQDEAHDAMSGRGRRSEGSEAPPPSCEGSEERRFATGRSQHPAEMEGDSVSCEPSPRARSPRVGPRRRSSELSRDRGNQNR